MHRINSKNAIARLTSQKVQCKLDLFYLSHLPGIFRLAGMKKALTTTLTFAAIVTLVGLVFKILHWPGANILLIAGLGSITMAGFLRLSQEEGVSAKIGAVAAGLLPAGILFKLMRWPNGQLMIYIALAFALLSIGFQAFSKKEGE